MIIDIIPCAVRSRNYIDKPMAIELHKDGISNSITTVAKDSYVIEVSDGSSNKD